MTITVEVLHFLHVFSEKLVEVCLVKRMFIKQCSGTFLVTGSVEICVVPDSENSVCEIQYLLQTAVTCRLLVCLKVILSFHPKTT